MKRSKLTERCALGHPKCSHTYGGKCYSIDFKRTPLPTPTAAHVIAGAPGSIPKHDRLRGTCKRCGDPVFIILSAPADEKLPPMFTDNGGVVRRHVHLFDPHLRRWIIDEELMS